MVTPIPHTLMHYTEDGVDLFGPWLDSLTDLIAQAAIAARLVRLELGLFGDCKSLEGGLFELRIDHGQGWRVLCFMAWNPGEWCCCWRAATNPVKKAPSKRRANA